ncbi:MAG: DUF5682 family protein, partial [Saprospiraceae bacterium]|nr:DUF5682 family protein [Saprospiraceae bacterium]
IDHWITSVTDEHFNSFLPILRRTFSRFSKSEKEVLFQLIKKGQQPDTSEVLRIYNAERESILIPVLDRLLDG